MYLFFCLNFFFLLAKGLTAALTLPRADEGDAAEAELFCRLSIFTESGFSAAAVSTCGGIPGDLEQTETSKIH